MLNLIVFLSAISFAIAKNYCAKINPSTSSGASGYYAMQIKNGIALHQYTLDISNAPTISTSSCSTNGVASLNININEFWAPGDGSTSSASLCATTTPVLQVNGQYVYLPITGLHYDPYFGCSMYSQNYLTYCQKGLKRVTPQYTYYCNSTGFRDQELYTSCEVGDITGKFGLASSSNSVFASKEIFVDPFPPLNANYRTSTDNALAWGSVAFQCSTPTVTYVNNVAYNTMTPTSIACAAFQEVSDADLSSSPCFDALSQMGTLNAPGSLSNTANNYSAGEFDAAVALSVILCLFFGSILGAMAMFYYIKRKQDGQGNAT
jgi:hypothetical protein